MFEKTVRICAVGMLLTCGLLFGGCTDESAADKENAAAQEIVVPDYAVVIYDDAASQVDEQIAASSSSSDDLGLVLEASFAIDDENRQVTIDVLVLTDDIEVACAKAEAVAHAFADYATVTDESGAVVMDEEGLGALWKAYDLILRVDNADGTLDLDGSKAASSDGINWQ